MVEAPRKRLLESTERPRRKKVNRLRQRTPLKTRHPLGKSVRAPTGELSLLRTALRNRIMESADVQDQFLVTLTNVSGSILEENDAEVTIMCPDSFSSQRSLPPPAGWGSHHDRWVCSENRRKHCLVSEPCDKWQRLSSHVQTTAG